MEAVASADLFAERGERGVGHFDHGAALFADEMEVLFGGEVVDGWSVADVDVFDDAEVFECFE